MATDDTDEIRKAMDVIRAVEKQIQDAWLELSLTEVMLEMAKEHNAKSVWHTWNSYSRSSI